MWKHAKCGGTVLPADNEGDYCSDCDQRELDDSQIYLDHYIINSADDLMGGTHV